MERGSERGVRRGTTGAGSRGEEGEACEEEANTGSEGAAGQLGKRLSPVHTGSTGGAGGNYTQGVLSIGNIVPGGEGWSTPGLSHILHPDYTWPLPCVSQLTADTQTGRRGSTQGGRQGAWRLPSDNAF